MEQSIVVEGFLQSIKMHGIKYHKLIADGDSSVHRKLIDSMPYGPTLPVQKIECRNHILRNYCTKIHEICKNKKLGDMNLRDTVASSVPRLRTAVVSAIKYRKNQTSDAEHTKVSELRKDILNSIHHTFGDHSGCQEREYFCDGTPKPGEVNIVPLLRETGIFEDIQRTVQRVANNSSSLILDVDNNVSELYNSIVAKIVGGKRVNFSLRGSYQTRCHAAAVSMNVKSDLHRLIHKNSVNKSPGFHTKKFIERRKKRMVNRRRLHYKGSKIRTSKKYEDNCDYGLGVSEIQEDMDENEFEKQKAEFITELHNEDGKEIEETTREQSASFCWRSHRSKRLTSSFFGNVCKMKTTTSCASLVKQIRYQVFKGNTSTAWGLQNESIAIAQFASQNNVEVRSSGLVVHQQYPFLAASPDGLIGENEIIEVKCPVSARSMSIESAVEAKRIKFLEMKHGLPSLKANHSYMYQVQGILNITGRQLCYFVVWSPLSMVVQSIEKDVLFWEDKMLPKLKKFYYNCLLPEIIDPRVPRKLTIRDPQYTTDAQNLAKEKKVT